ncbi:DNA cytosine methyltransferase [Clostridium estertheticum]|uniref:DNA cytosine methyltransferase n=1 Tax=Clostridium estertheticum TaxID=238834 RepID=UPI001CF29A17|nr:DNA cytosine methyltransferase [Clostridium estertheticum]MCB2354732.1 DNA cytosine methyltransferase [Clostridium estertheticum]WAG40974.1 DNA cytosine methyltransferase [Clostridium estertheticum]
MPYAIDLFCGAGGFSEGIIQAGFEIVFSSDKSHEVMKTYTNRHKQLGLIEGVNTHFELTDIRELTGIIIFETISNLTKFKDNKIQRGDIDVTFGGPPCQGFSRAGKRDVNDPRNMLFHEYLRIIQDVFPKYVVMENVSGFMDMEMLDFPSVIGDKKYLGQKLVKDILQKELEELGYNVLTPRLLNASDYGVPQNRRRAVFIAWRKDMPEPSYPKPTTSNKDEKISVREALAGVANDQESIYSIQSMNGRTVNDLGEAIPEKKIRNQELSSHSKSVHQRFSIYKCGESTKAVKDRVKNSNIEIKKLYPELFYETLFQVNKEKNEIIIQRNLNYLGIDKQRFQKARWLGDTNKLFSEMIINDTNKKAHDKYIRKLANRLDCKVEVANNFMVRGAESLNSYIISEDLEERFRTGENLTDDIMEALFTKKNSRKRLDPEAQAPTMVTLPDDFIHPYEDRILSVREMARFQSFDDSFVFWGKRTTGGEKRKIEVPQYTQVGNAVPPLLAKAIAQSIKNALKKNERS